MLLAIETSCDETGVALLTPEGEVVADLISSQVQLHAPYGGVVPELAAREHTRNLPLLLAEALSTAGIGLSQISAIAVTRGPGLKVCLLVGVSFAKSLAYSLRIPLLPVHHLQAHINACFLDHGGKRPEFPLLALVVSGGHTLLVRMREASEATIIARTRDDAAGEAFDKIASLLKLGYPGGPALAAAADEGDARRFRLPVGMAGEPNWFSFSGLKTAVLRLTRELGAAVNEPQIVNDLAASVQAAIVEALVVKTEQACLANAPKSVLLCGGVAANQALRQRLAELAATRGIEFFVPTPRWCTDNGAMVGAVGLEIVRRHRNWQPTAGEELGPECPLTIGPLARWPLASD